MEPTSQINVIPLKRGTVLVRIIYYSLSSHRLLHVFRHDLITTGHLSTPYRRLPDEVCGYCNGHNAQDDSDSNPALGTA